MAGLGTTSAASRSEPPTNTFKDWTVICDNLRNCEADGFAVEGAEKPAILQLNRSGAPSAQAGVTIWLLLEDAIEAARGKPVVLAVDDRPVLTVQVEAEGVIKLADSQAARLLGAARNASQLSVRFDDDDLGVVSLAGMVAALRRIDDQQARAGTVTAMIAKGAAPASAVPPQPATPVIRRAPPAAQTGLPAKPPASVRALRAKAGCDVGSETFNSELEVSRLSADTVLWQAPCGAGAYNSTELFVIVDNKSGKARIAPIEGVEDGLLENAAYDPQTRLLATYNKGRSIGDCGDSIEWVWTGQVFEMSRMTSMPICRGQGAWPTSFQVKVE